MRYFPHAEAAEEIIVQSPSDIIMTAQVIQKYIFLWERKDLSQLMSQQADIFGRNGVPGARHGRNIIEHMTFRFFHTSEIRYYLGRLHDDFAKQQRSRADDFRSKAHHPHQRMNLGKVPTAGSEFFPDIRDGIQANDIYALVAKEQHVLRHIVEHDWIRIVQIPLIRIKGRHHNLACFLTPAEVARCCCRKHLRHGFLILIGLCPVVIEKVACLTLCVSGACTPCPLVIFTCMVHDEVQAD